MPASLQSPGRGPSAPAARGQPRSSTPRQRCCAKCLVNRRLDSSLRPPMPKAVAVASVRTHRTAEPGGLKDGDRASPPRTVSAQPVFRPPRPFLLLPVYAHQLSCGGGRPGGSTCSSPRREARSPVSSGPHTGTPACTWAWPVPAEPTFTLQLEAGLPGGLSRQPSLKPAF